MPDNKFSQWNEGPYNKVVLKASRPLSEALTHLYVFVPIRDNDKYCRVGGDEVNKLLAWGEGSGSAITRPKKRSPPAICDISTHVAATP